jgi:hypothetical protein
VAFDMNLMGRWWGGELGSRAVLVPLEPILEPALLAPVAAVACLVGPRAG